MGNEGIGYVRIIDFQFSIFPSSGTPHRDVWTEDELFGSAEMSAEDEFMCLNEIFKMKLSPGKSYIVDRVLSLSNSILLELFGALIRLVVCIGNVIESCFNYVLLNNFTSQRWSKI